MGFRDDFGDIVFGVHLLIIFVVMMTKILELRIAVSEIFHGT